MGNRAAAHKDESKFTTSQYDAIYPKGIEQHYWTMVRNRIITRAIKKQGVKGEVLEIGCGRGIVVEYLNKQGFNCSGVELANVSVPSSLQGKVLAGKDVNDLPPEYCDRFTVILLLDVIEHIVDPVSFFQNIKSKFKNLQVVVLTVPAAQELFSNYDEFNGHYRRYSWQMLGDFAARTGIYQRDKSYLFHALYLPARFTLWLFGKRKLYMSAPRGMAKFIHAVVAQALWLDMLLLPKKLKGTSLIAVYKIF